MPLAELMNQVIELNCEKNGQQYKEYDFYIVLDTGKEIFLSDYVDKYNLSFHYITRFSKLKYICKAIEIEFPLKNNEVRHFRTSGEKSLSWATLKEKLIEKYADLLPEEFSIIQNINGTNKHVQAQDFVACDSCISI